MGTSRWYSRPWQTPSAKFAKSHLRRSKICRPKVRLSPNTLASLLESLCIPNANQHLCCRADSRSSLSIILLCKQTKSAWAKCSIESRTRAQTLRWCTTCRHLKKISQSTCQSSCAPCRRASGRKSSKWAELAKAMKSVCKAPHSLLLAQREACFTEFFRVN